jgi:hypothetical protein
MIARCTLPVLLLLALSLPARADPLPGPLARQDSGIRVHPWALTDDVERQFGPTGGACASGPDYLVAMAYGLGLKLVGPGEIPGWPYVWPLLDENDYPTKLPGASVKEIRAVVSSWDRQKVLLGYLEGDYGVGAPIVAIDFDGNASILASAAEMLAAAKQKVQVWSMTAAPDGLVYAVLWGQDPRLVRIDPSRPEGQRVTEVLTRSSLEDAHPTCCRAAPRSSTGSPWSPTTRAASSSRRR